MTKIICKTTTKRNKSTALNESCVESCKEINIDYFLAIILLADIVGWKRASLKQKFRYTCNIPELLEGKLCTQYEYIQNKFCISRERVRKAITLLENLGVIQRATRNMLNEKGNRIDKLLINLDEQFFVLYRGM